MICDHDSSCGVYFRVCLLTVLRQYKLWQRVVCDLNWLKNHFVIVQEQKPLGGYVRLVLGESPCHKSKGLTWDWHFVFCFVCVIYIFSRFVSTRPNVLSFYFDDNEQWLSILVGCKKESRCFVEIWLCRSSYLPLIYQIKDSNRSIKGLEEALTLIKTCGINQLFASAYHTQRSMCA